MKDESGRQRLFKELEKLATEQRNSNSEFIDTAKAKEIVQIINAEDKQVADLVGEKTSEIAAAVELVKEAISNGGRLLYFGAGTSGRLGVLDAAECPPTFGVTPDVVQGYIAGGKEAMFVAQEGAEDFEENGAEDIKKAQVKDIDIVCGLAASGRTPYVHGALKEASRIGAKTIFIVTVPKSQVNVFADILIDVPVGPEVIMGSTRMKSATAQKMVLNMITTGAMIRLGKVYENVMVDLMLTNEKLHERAKRIIMMLTEASYEQAEDALQVSEGNVKTAITMLLLDISREEAKSLLDSNQGFLRNVLLNSEK